MKRMGLLLSIMFWLLLIPVMKVEAAEIVDSGECGDNVTWTLDDEGTLVISGEGEMWSYHFNDLHLNNNYCPFPTDKVISVVIEKGVTSIGQCAFSDCSNMEKIVIPSGVTKIGAYSFINCTSLTEIELPSGITDIYQYAFFGCYNLEEIILSPGLKMIYEYAFEECRKIEKIELPSTVEVIKEYVFTNCDNLREINLPLSIESIGEGAFSSCEHIEEIELPSSITSIEKHMFNGCENLKTIVIPSKITSVGDYAFRNCDSVKFICVANSYAHQYAIENNIPYLLVSGSMGAVSASNGGISSITQDSAETNNELCANKNHILSKANYTEFFKTTNMASQYKTVTLDYAEGIVNEKTITIDCQVKGDEDTVKEYALYQKDRKLAASETGELTVTLDEACTGMDYYVIVTDINGGRTKTALQLMIKTFKEGKSSEVQLGGENYLSVKLPEDIPFFGGAEFELDSYILPVFVTKTDEDTVRVGVNIKKDMLKDDSLMEEFKEEWRELFKFKNRMEKSLATNWNTLKRYAQMPSHNGHFDKKKLEFSFIGYGEGSYDEEGNIIASVTLMCSVSGSHTWGHQFIVPIVIQVPVVVEAKLSFEGELEGELVWKWSDSGIDFESGEACLKLEGGVSVFGGVGLRKIIAAGVFGGGKLGTEIVLLSTKREGGFESVDLTLEAGLKGYIGPLKGELVLANKTWNIYSREETENVAEAAYFMNARTLMQNAYEEETYQLTDEIYDSKFVNEQGVVGTVIEDAFLSAQPVIASLEDYTVMVYLMTDSDRPVSDSTVLMYSVYDKASNNWSVPKQVDADATMDWTASLYSDGTTLRLVYEQQKTTLPENITISDLTKGMKITTAVFDTETMSFVEFEDVVESSETVYASSPVVAEIDGTTMLAWVQKATGDYFGTDGENSVYYSSLTQTGWSEPALLVDKLNCVTDLTLGLLGEEKVVAYITDNDNNLETYEDGELVLFSLNGAQRTITSGEIGNLRFATLPGQSVATLVWYETGNIGNLTATDAEKTVLFDVAEDGQATNYVESNFEILGDKIIFSRTDVNGVSTIYFVDYENGTYSSASPRIYATGTVTAFSTDEELAVWVDTVSLIQENSIEDSSAIKYCMYQQLYDIAVVYAEFDENNLHPGTKLPVTISVKNNADAELAEVTVMIQNENNEVVLETSAKCNIGPGETGEIEVELMIPETLENAIYTVSIGGEKTDTTPENNMVELDLSLTELSLTVYETVYENAGYIVAEITNESYVNTSGTLIFTDMEGTVLYSEDIVEIPAKNSYSVAVELTILFLTDSSSEQAVVVKVITEKEEYSSLNNTVLKYSPVLTCEIPYVSIVFLNGETELSNTVYTVGSSVEPETLPVDTVGWYELGDETQTIVTDFTNITTDMVYVAKRNIVEQIVEKNVCVGTTVDVREYLLEQEIVIDNMTYSCDSETVTVDADGVVTVVSSGTATVTAVSDTDKVTFIFTIAEHKYPEEWTLTLEPSPENPGLYTKHCENCGKVEEKEIAILKFSGASLTLSSDISVKYEVNETLFAEEAYSNPYVKFKFNDKEITVSEYTVKDGKYIFAFNDIAPKQINDTIYATLYAELNGQEFASATREYSVATYCYNMLDKCMGNDSYASFCTLLVDMLNYGAAAQIYFNYNTDNMVNASLTAEQAALGTQETPILEDILDRTYVEAENPLVSWKGAGLRLEEAVTIRFKIATDDLAGLVMKVESESGGTWSIPSSKFTVTDGGYFVFFDGLRASKMSEPVYATVYKGDVAVSNTIKYSIESYACSMQDSTDVNLTELLIAMMKYGNAANTYVNEGVK